MVGLLYALEHRRFVLPHKVLVLQLLQRIKAAEVDFVVILPAWSSQQVAEALTMVVDNPVTLECREQLLEPLYAYGVPLPRPTKRSGGSAATGRHWDSFVRKQKEGKHASHAAFAKGWQDELRQCTR